MVAHTPLELQLVQALEAEAVAHGIDIVDVEVGGTGKAPVVRVRVDHADESLPAITLDEVGEQSAWIDAAVEEIDPFPGSYLLEVSSPGMARPLRRERDFVRFAGATVQLLTTATEGRRKYTGLLSGMVEGRVALFCDDGGHTFALDEIRACTIKPDYEAAARDAKAAARGRG